MSKTIEEAFGVKTRKPIPLAAACPLGQGSNVEIDPDFQFSDRSLKRTLNNIRRTQPIWIWGPSGCGKTEFARQIAGRLERNCHILSFGEETSIRELMGSYELTRDGDQVITRYKPGSLVKAIQDPMALVVLDEFNMAPPGITAQLNRLLEARELVVPETGEKVKAAEGVTFIATANTSGGSDATGMSAGSMVQNAATRNRFAGLKVDYLDPDQEAELIRRKIRTADGKTIDEIINLGNKPASEVMVQLAGSIRALTEEGKVSQAFSVRTHLNWGISALMNGSFTDGFRDAYLDLLDPVEEVAVTELFKKVVGLDPETGQPLGG